jgi:hypothetical protein
VWDDQELANVNLRTPLEDFSRDEKAKLSTNGLTIAIKDRSSQSNLYNQLRNTHEELGEVVETLAKSYGTYLEFNRAQPRINDNKKNKKDWMYMIRIAIPGGGPITKCFTNFFLNGSTSTIPIFCNMYFILAQCLFCRSPILAEH